MKLGMNDPANTDVTRPVAASKQLAARFAVLLPPSVDVHGPEQHPDRGAYIRDRGREIDRQKLQPVLLENDRQPYSNTV